MIIKNAQVFCEDGKFRTADVAFDKKILAVGEESDRKCYGQIIDGTDMLLLPGFIDIHIHGASGVEADMTDMDGMHRMARFLACSGTTTFCPASMALPETELIRFAETVRDFISGAREAYMAGIYLEGPFLSESKPGAHKREYIRKPDTGLLKKIDEASGHRISFVMAAPETESVEVLIRTAAHMGAVCIGHTNCDYESALMAIDAGASQLTHTFNAMPELMHRAPGPIGAAMDREIRAELICDGIHVHPPVVRSAFRMFPGRIILISDALECAGLPDGEYTSGGQKIILKDRRASLSDGTLAGSVLTMADAFRNAVNFGISIEDAAAAASSVPAQTLGIYGTKGCIRTGADADLILMDRDLTIKHVFLRGADI